jgi:hypothetical protein
VAHPERERIAEHERDPYQRGKGPNVHTSINLPIGRSGGCPGQGEVLSVFRDEWRPVHPRFGMRIVASERGWTKPLSDAIDIIFGIVVAPLNWPRWLRGKPFSDNVILLARKPRTSK